MAQILTYRYNIEPKALEAETGVSGVEIPLQPTVETVVSIPDGSTEKDIDHLDAAMFTRGYIRVGGP